MKLGKAKDQQVTVKGYCVEVVKQKGYMTVQSGPGYPYVVPDSYVMATCHNDRGDEFYIVAPKDMFAGQS